jgi:hypothetical protein
LIDWDEESDENLKSRSKINRIMDAVGGLASVKAVMARQED